MTKRPDYLWRTDRFVVEIATCGPISKKAIAFAIAELLGDGNLVHKVTKYPPEGWKLQAGPPKVKDFDRVFQAECVRRLTPARWLEIKIKAEGKRK